MANDEGRKQQEEDDEVTNVTPNGKLTREQRSSKGSVSETEEEEEEEPRLKYASLTNHLKPVYRNGDATSTFLVAGDKMVLGTHNGYIHVYSVPDFQPIRVFHAHQASISALSISPCPPPLAATKSETPHNPASTRKESPARPNSKAGKGNATKPSSAPAVPNTPSNSIFVSSSSIDGNVFVSSLVDPKDVQLRSFGRPVQAVGLSPEFKSDRAYLSGGLAGSLVLTTGGQIGTKSTATTAGAAVATSNWLGSIGLGSHSGKDQVLHSGEGAISTIKWSLSGRYVVWVNEQGIKILRSNLHLQMGQSDLAWKRISHIDHPNRPGWDEMAGVWKAHVQWVDEAGLESDDFYGEMAPDDDQSVSADLERMSSLKQSRTSEKLIVGWAGTIWIVNVHPTESETPKDVSARKPGRAEIVTILRLDCTISGISLYTPSLVIVLAFLSPEEDLTSQKPTRRGVSRRQNALPPEIRIIDINSKEEVSVADAMDVSRFGGLSATDYHLGVLPAIRLSQKSLSHRGTLEAIGGGIEAIGGGIWDATMYPARLFTTTAGAISGGSPSSSQAPSVANFKPEPRSSQSGSESTSAVHTHGMKIFIQSPYDCIIATKPSLSDHYNWLSSHEMFEDAWKLLDRHPEAAPSDSHTSANSPSKGSMTDFFADDSSINVLSLDYGLGLHADKEKLRVGERWIQQLVSSEDWAQAGKICGLVLGSSSTWENWVMAFAKADKFDEITPYIPTEYQGSPLPPAVYEIILTHYVATDRPRFRELLEDWPPELFDVDTILEAVQTRFKSGEVREDSIEDGQTGRDWRLLLECLAKLYLAVGRPRKALRCFIQLQNADAAMALIAEAHLVGAVADDIPGFILLQVNKEQQRSASLSELATQTLDPIRLLVSEAHHGVVMPDTIIRQLKSRFGMPNPYLYFYFRALWHGDVAPSQEGEATARTTLVSERLLADEGRNLVSDHADMAVELFANYDRDLLMTFLKASQTYNLSLASQLCEKRNYIPELVYLLSKEGRTTQALRLIIDQLGDVSQAIAFAKDQNDTSLWDDLLDYSMNKPSFIRGLLEEVGTSIDPLKLVKRIPPGLEIEGLREGLSRMMREFEVQESISKGVARVLRGEVNAAMQQRSSGLRKGIRFDVAKGKRRKDQERRASVGQVKLKDIRRGLCAGCGDAVNEQDHPPQYLLAFPCSHIFHLPCLLDVVLPPGTKRPSFLNQFTDPPVDDEDEWEVPPYDPSIGPKVDRARLLRTVLGDGCPLEEKEGEE